MMAHPPLSALDAARLLTARGWVVFPADRPDSGLHCSGSARACRERRCGAESDASKRGKHPAVVSRWGELSEPVSDGQLAEWFAPGDGGTSRYNVAVACGPSGLLVVDDDAAGGFERAAEALDGKLPETFRVRSSARGWHWWWTVPCDEHGQRVPVGNAPGLLAGYGCDVRGGASPSHPHGGYVIGPGSQHWTDDPDAYVAVDWDAPACEAPEWLISAVTNPGRVTTPGPSGRTEGVPDRTGTAGGGTGHGPGLTRWDSAPRYGSAADLRDQYARHCAEVTEPGNAFRWGLFLAARDGWRLVELGLLDEDELQRDMAACVWRVWHADPDERDVKIVMWEALDGPHGALASPWELTAAEQRERARAAGSRPVGRFTRPGDVIEPGIESISADGAVTSDNGVPDHTTYGNLAVADAQDSTQLSTGSAPGVDIDLSSAEALAREEAEDQAYRRELDLQRRRQRARLELAAEALPPLVPRSYLTFRATPKPSYLIPQMLYRNGLAVVFGEPGAGKSYLLIDIALSLATASVWRGHRLTGRDGGPGMVHYVMAEGVDVNNVRAEAWEYYHDADPHSIEGHFVTFEDGIALSEPGIAQYLIVVRRDRPDLIILDTRNALFVGKESSGEDYGAMINVLNMIRRAAGGCAVVLVDHSGLGDKDRPRGSNALVAGVHTMIQVTDDKEAGVYTARETGRNKAAGPQVAEWSWRLHAIEDVPHEGLSVPAVCVPALTGDHRPIELDPGKWWTPELPEALIVLCRETKGMGRRAAPLVLKLLRALEGYDYLQSKIIRMVMRDGLSTRAPVRASEATVQNAINLLIDLCVIERTDAAGVGTRIRLAPEYSRAEMPT